MAMVQGSRLTDEFNAYIPTERIVVIPNGVDERPFEAARARQTKTSPHAIPKHVLFVGLLVREKGFRDVIQAIPHVPQAQFVFAGEWPSDQDRVEVETFLKEHGVADRVTFTGVVSGDAKYALFVSAHLFVFPTYFVYEGHAVSSVEALAAGLPIVCTNHGALNESVREGWNGFFVPRADPTAVAMCINQLLQDEPLRQKMGARSRQLFLERFTLDTFINQWAAAVRTCAESPNLR